MEEKRVYPNQFYTVKDGDIPMDKISALEAIPRKYKWDGLLKMKTQSKV